ncbi:MAG: hypothetical protein IT541_15625 [Hyphomicrobiales bacterium]|nr:hypothetical protein [Hyphomicrobiales bacterium]
MEIRLTPGQHALIYDGIKAERYHTPEDAVDEALAQWESQQNTLIILQDVLAEEGIGSDGLHEATRQAFAFGHRMIFHTSAEPTATVLRYTEQTWLSAADHDNDG